ncbi:LysR family transcriptional regulator [Sphingobium rhizovicinum]|uniref:LysR family transcriptional regulator n=1 Tax=Sphingobium rhizovicinum TaxID=432308 RepID=A0ABV7NKT9_9SPHN
MIERYLVHYFLAVVDQGNFSRAAQHCRVSQPTLSVGIAKLEAMTGHMLFHRTNRRVELTSFGATFAVHARRIEAEFAMAMQAMATDQKSRLVRIGVISTLPSSWIENATREACKVEGERVEIVEGRMRDLLPRLERGRIDAIAGIVGNDPRARDTWFEEGYALALSATHRLAQRRTLEAEELADCDMLVRRNCEALSQVSQFFTQRGIRPFFAARTTNDDRAAAYVRSGLGLTVMPRCYAQAGIAMPELSGFDLRRRIGLLVDPANAARIDDSQSVQRFSSAIRAANASLTP